jgi:hypothetical protein
MTQPWSKEINDELQPGMARLFASDNLKSNENQTIVSDKKLSERIKYGSSVNQQGTERTQSKPIFNVSNHLNSKQEKLHQNQSSLKKGLNFNPKIQSNRALSSMLRKIQSRQDEPQYQNKFSNGYNENLSQLSNIQGISNPIPNNIYQNQGIPSNTNTKKSRALNSQFKNQTNYFENSNQSSGTFLNNLRKSSFQHKAESSTYNSNQQSPNSAILQFQKSNYNGKYPTPPPPKLPPEGREIPPFLSFGSDEGINPYQIEHKNPYDSTLTDALSESISGNKRFSSGDDVKGNEYQKQDWNTNNSRNSLKNNQNDAQNRLQTPNVYHKSRIDQVNHLNHLKRVNLRNQATSLFTNAQNHESMNREPSYYSSRENNYENSSQKRFGLYNEHKNQDQLNQANQGNLFGKFNPNSNIRHDQFERNGQNQITPKFNNSNRLNNHNSNIFGSNQLNSRNLQNPNTWDNFHQKTLSLKERLYKNSSNNLGFQGYPQENQSYMENNFETPFQVENAKFRNDQQEAFPNYSQNNLFQNSLQDDLLNNTIDNINEIEEDPEQREISIVENLQYIQQAEPVKLELLHILMDRNKHADCQLLRKIKKKRYMGTVALGMILYNLIETFGSDMISKNYEEGNDIYSISERFSGLLERAFNI